MNFKNIVDFLKNSGILSFLVPFLLIFSIIYVIIEEIKIFNIKNYNGKKLNIIVSFSISLIFVISAKYIFIINNLFPKIAAFFLFLLTLEIIASLLEIDIEAIKSKTWFRIFFLILIILILVLSFITINKILTVLSFINSEIISVILIILIIWLISKEPNKRVKDKKSKNNIFKNSGENTLENNSEKLDFNFNDLEKEANEIKPGETIKKRI